MSFRYGFGLYLLLREISGSWVNRHWLGLVIGLKIRSITALRLTKSVTLQQLLYPLEICQCHNALLSCPEEKFKQNKVLFSARKLKINELLNVKPRKSSFLVFKHPNSGLCAYSIMYLNITKQRDGWGSMEAGLEEHWHLDSLQLN